MRLPFKLLLQMLLVELQVDLRAINQMSLQKKCNFGLIENQMCRYLIKIVVYVKFQEGKCTKWNFYKQDKTCSK